MQPSPMLSPLRPRRRRLQFFGYFRGEELSAEREEVKMARLVRLDRSGHTELAEWVAEDERSYEQAARRFREELDGGYMGVARLVDGSYEQVKELPHDVELVMLRRPIVGG